MTDNISAALNVRSTIAGLRRKARTVRPVRYGDGLRELANKLEKRARMNLSLRWWMDKAKVLIDDK